MTSRTSSTEAPPDEVIAHLAWLFSEGGDEVRIHPEECPSCKRLAEWVDEAAKGLFG